MELHEQARLLLDSVPEGKAHFNKPGRVMIAVERHDKESPDWVEPQERFLWIKGRTKLKIGQIREAYQSQYQSIEPNLAISITMDGSTPMPDDWKLSDVNVSGDGIIAFTAVEQDPNTSGQRADTLAPSHSMAAGHNHSPGLRTHLRSPLQQVNRQLSVPSQRSLDELALKPNNFNEHVLGVTPTRGNTAEAYSARQSTTPLVPQFDQQAITNPMFLEPATTLPTSQQQTAIVPKQEEPSTPSKPLNPEHPADHEASQEVQLREYDDPFADPHGDEIEPSRRGQALRELAKDSMPEKLEAGVNAGLDILSQIQAQLEKIQTPDAMNWLNQIETVRKDAVKSRTIVGVVGNTGAGKSSVINAMLDEERLVPTNCMRACTAVVTEISYNTSKQEKSAYRAEIEFIQAEEWRKELKVLVDEIFDDNGHLLSDARDPDSPAGIAYAKIRAVYHKYTKDMLAKATVESLMREPKVKSILGTTKRFVNSDPDDFYHGLQKYVDSKEKGTEQLDKNGNKIGLRKRAFECWPLIKVVRIYTKSDALSTGAVIVDLPGVHDSNAARAAVAEGYMKQCTGLWIVAPITRAVDDKAAKSLLGNTFKRQLKYDGTYSAVTFICSKTDDISRTEAADTLELGPEMAEIENQLDQLMKQRKTLTASLRTARNEKQDHSAAVDDIDDQLEVWEGLKDKFDEGVTVYAPTVRASKKRKRAPNSPAGRKKRRQRLDLSQDDESEYVDLISDDEAEEDDSVAVSSEDRAPLTEAEIDQKIEELKQLKKDARREKAAIDERVRDLSKQLRTVEEEEEGLDDRHSELCIAGRNQYSKSAIQLDFAAGVKELDQENAEEEDPDNFNPDEDIRDYDEVARSLPVFCVSSRAYQKLCGRLQKDKEVAGFTKTEQTEIPQLQAHCKKLTEQGRLANCRRFLNSLNQLSSSLSLWASDDGTGVKLTGQQRDAEKSFLQRKLKDLEEALETLVSDTLDDVSETLKEQVFDKFPTAIQSAAAGALPTAEGWGAHRNSGGLHFMTYKATVRRQGVYTGASGFKDFNQALFDPVQKQLASGWEKAFHRRFPHILSGFTKTASKLLTQFHAAVETRCPEKGVGIARIGMLGNSLHGYQAVFNDMVAKVTAHINDGQRETNRAFTPCITACMDPAYDLCANESGIGSFKRMKEHMRAHVQENKVSMFDEACDQVHGALDALIGKARTMMLDHVDAVYVGIQRDYLSLIGGVNVQPQEKLPREERAVRRNIDEVIAAADAVFENVVNGETGHESFLEGAAEEGQELVDEEMEDVSEQDDTDSGTEDQDEDEEGGVGVKQESGDEQMEG